MKPQDPEGKLTKTEQLVERIIKECEITFSNGKPNKAHPYLHGELRDTYLVIQFLGGGLNDLLEWNSPRVDPVWTRYPNRIQLWDTVNSLLKAEKLCLCCDEGDWNIRAECSDSFCASRRLLQR